MPVDPETYEYDLKPIWDRIDALEEIVFRIEANIANWQDAWVKVSNSYLKWNDKLEKLEDENKKWLDVWGKESFNAKYSEILKQALNRGINNEQQIEKLESVLKDLIIVVHNYWEGNSPVGWDDEKYFYRLRDLKKRLEGQNKEAPKQDLLKGVLNEIEAVDRALEIQRKEFVEGLDKAIDNICYDFCQNDCDDYISDAHHNWSDEILGWCNPNGYLDHGKCGIYIILNRIKKYSEEATEK